MDTSKFLCMETKLQFSFIPELMRLWNVIFGLAQDFLNECITAPECSFAFHATVMLYCAASRHYSLCRHSQTSTAQENGVPPRIGHGLFSLVVSEPRCWYFSTLSLFCVKPSPQGPGTYDCHSVGRNFSRESQRSGVHMVGWNGVACCGDVRVVNE